MIKATNVKLIMGTQGIGYNATIVVNGKPYVDLMEAADGGALRIVKHHTSDPIRNVIRQVENHGIAIELAVERAIDASPALIAEYDRMAA